MRIRLVGISFTGLVRGTYQINMFEDTEEMVALYQALDKMKKRYGFDAVGRANSILKQQKVLSTPFQSAAEETQNKIPISPP